MIDLTVAICTWNRAKLLDQTLTRFRELTIPDGLCWEVIVVDNNCTDNTMSVVTQHQAHLPLRGVVETKQGHSHARNRAVAEAKGNYLLWTDDDVLVDADWIVNHLQAVHDYPEAKFFGGPVRPWYETPPPGWVTRHFNRVKHCWAIVDLGPKTRPLRATEYPCGANVGFRLEVMHKYPFDPKYGRIGAQLSSEDETRVIEAIRRDGGEGVWIGNAGVDHFLPANRITPKYVFEITRWLGYHGYGDFAKDDATSFRNAPRWIWKRYLMTQARSRIYSPFKNDAWIDSLLESARWHGMIARFQKEARS